MLDQKTENIFQTPQGTVHQAYKCANAKICKKEVGHRLNKTTTMCYAKKIIWHFKGVSLPQSSRRNKLDFAA